MGSSLDCLCFTSHIGKHTIFKIRIQPLINDTKTNPATESRIPPHPTHPALRLLRPPQDIPLLILPRLEAEHAPLQPGKVQLLLVALADLHRGYGRRGLPRADADAARGARWRGRGDDGEAVAQVLQDLGEVVHDFEFTGAVYLYGMLVVLRAG